MLCPNGTVKPFLVSLVEPVAYLKSELNAKNGVNYVPGRPILARFADEGRGRANQSATGASRDAQDRARRRDFLDEDEARAKVSRDRRRDRDRRDVRDGTLQIENSQIHEILEIFGVGLASDAADEAASLNPSDADIVLPVQWVVP